MKVISLSLNEYMETDTETMSKDLPQYTEYNEYLCSIKDCLIKVTYFLNLVFILILIYTYVHTVCVICYPIPYVCETIEDVI